MTRTSLFYVLSCAALVAVVSNCGSNSPAGGGTAGTTGSAGATGTAGSTIPTGNGSGGDTGNAGTTGNAGDNGNAGAVGEAGRTGGTAGRNGGGGAGGATVTCREATTCSNEGGTCTTDCARGQQNVCACVQSPTSGTRLEWACAAFACNTTTDAGVGGGGRDAGRRDGGIVIGDGGIVIGDGGIVIGDGGITVAVCPADATMAATTCDANAICNTACTNMMRRTCFCGANGHWACSGQRRCQ